MKFATIASPDTGVPVSGNFLAGRSPGALFLALWLALLLAKAWVAASLPLLVDEAFYAWEGRFPAFAYSDLPGLTAWLTRIGTELGGQNGFALRAPFLVIGSLIPLLVVRISRRWFGSAVGWWSGVLALAMPLPAMLGVLAVPDVPLVFAALLCVDAIAVMFVACTWPASMCLALALGVGAMTHYRFALVVAAGLAGLLMEPRGRHLFKKIPFVCAVAVGACAWIPLIVWNFQHASAGVQFQLVDRNPWTFDMRGLWWIAIQAVLVTPLLFALLFKTLLLAWRLRGTGKGPPWGFLAGIATVSVIGYFIMGFFVDRERVSFHWPLAGWLVLVTAAPVAFKEWGKVARACTLVFAFLGVAFALGFLVAAKEPALREALAGSSFYPKDFSGWAEAQQIGRTLGASPGRKTIVASDFSVGSQLAFALDRPDILVLDSPLNHKHGRSAQLADWGLLRVSRQAEPVSFVLNDTGISMKDRLAEYHRMCTVLGPITHPQVFNVDRIGRRLLSFELSAANSAADCVTPALATIDSPAAGAVVSGRFDVVGWAFKDGAGLDSVVITLDGAPIAHASYGEAMPHVAAYWRVSTDPNQPNVGFRASLDAAGRTSGEHWLGLTMHGADGSVEAWPPQKIVFHK